MKILLAVDGSKHSRWATQWLARLPLKNPPEVRALHVVDLTALHGPFMMQPAVSGNDLLINQSVVQEEIGLLQARAKRILAGTTRLMKSLKLRSRAQSLTGPVASVILKEAERAGLIVMGGRGLGVLDRLLTGSVSTQMMLHAPCPALVVKQPPRPVRRILLAMDGSKPSDKALRFLLREMAPKKQGATVTVLVTHVMPRLKYPELKEAAAALVHSNAARLAKAGFRVGEILRIGTPADEIMKAADHQKADVIVTGALGLGAIARFLLGSVSMKLVQRSSQSVLVVR
jgi:nucleotide-binding universal stress UspA family protein